MANPRRSPLAGGKSLETVDDQDQNPRPFPEDPQGIGRADIAATALPEVDSAEASDQVAGWNRTQQVANQRHQAIADPFHRMNLGILPLTQQVDSGSRFLPRA